MNTPEFYDQVYQDNPDKWNTWYRDKFAYETISPFLFHPNSFVDIGCGNGHTLAYLKSKIPDAKYFGIDSSPGAIEIAKARYPGIEFICGYLGTGKVPLCHIGLCMGVLEHVENIVPALKLLLNHANIVYLEVPDNLLGSDDEGYRVSPGGQYEWFLKRETWERYIDNADIEIMEARKGPAASRRS